MRLPYLGTQFIIFLLIVNNVKAPGSDDELSADAPPPPQNFQGERTGIDAEQNNEAQPAAVATAVANPSSEQDVQRAREGILLEGTDVPDFIMDQYFELLTRNDAEFAHVPTNVFNHFHLGEDKKIDPQWIAEFTEDRFRRIQLWYIPVQLNTGTNTYWTLATYDVERGIMVLFDPINPFYQLDIEAKKDAISKRAEQFFAKLHAHFGDMPKKWPPSWESLSNLLKKHPVVEDSGIAAMEIAHTIRDQLSIYVELKFDAENVPLYRREIHDQLCHQNKLIPTDHTRPATIAPLNENLKINRKSNQPQVPELTAPAMPLHPTPPVVFTSGSLPSQPSNTRDRWKTVKDRISHRNAKSHKDLRHQKRPPLAPPPQQPPPSQPSTLKQPQPAQSASQPAPPRRRYPLLPSEQLRGYPPLSSELPAEQAAPPASQPALPRPRYQPLTASESPTVQAAQSPEQH